MCYFLPSIWCDLMVPRILVSSKHNVYSASSPSLIVSWVEPIVDMHLRWLSDHMMLLGAETGAPYISPSLDHLSSSSSFSSFTF